jgi:hypothetical protein
MHAGLAGFVQSPSVVQLRVWKPPASGGALDGAGEHAVSRAIAASGR